jgi:hypothetical protein
MQRTEIGISVNAKDDCFAVNDELLLPIFQSGLDNPRIAFAPIVPALRDQAYPVAVAMNEQAMTVIFDLIYQSRPSGTVWIWWEGRTPT